MKEKKERKEKNRNYHYTASLRVAQEALNKLNALGLEDKLPCFKGTFRISLSNRRKYRLFNGSSYEDMIATPIVIVSPQEKRRTVIFINRKMYGPYFPFVVKLFMTSDSVTFNDIKIQPKAVDSYEHHWKIEKVFLGRLEEPGYYPVGVDYIIESVEFSWGLIEKAAKKHILKMLKKMEVNYANQRSQRLEEFIRQT